MEELAKANEYEENDNELLNLFDQDNKISSAKDESANRLLNQPPFSDYLGKNKLTAYKSTGNGNCFYNSLSLLLNDDETLAGKIRLNILWEIIQDENEAFMPHNQG